MKYCRLYVRATTQVKRKISLGRPDRNATAIKPSTRSAPAAVRRGKTPTTVAIINALMPRRVMSPNPIKDEGARSSLCDMEGMFRRASVLSERAHLLSNPNGPIKPSNPEDQENGGKNNE